MIPRFFNAVKILRIRHMYGLETFPQFRLSHSNEQMNVVGHQAVGANASQASELERLNVFVLGGIQWDFTCLL